MLRWIPTIWLGFIACRYGVTAFNTVREPFSEGWDIAWSVAWLAVLLALTVSAVLFKPSVLNRIWWGLVASVAVIILLLSYTILPAVTALVLFAVAIGIGEFVIHRLELGPTALVERLVVTASAGTGFLALGQLSIAALGLFNPITSWALLLILGIPALFGLRRLFTLRPEIDLGKYSLIIAPIGYVFLLNLTWATAPEIQFDPLNVHLAVPRLYLQHGGLVDLPYFFHSYFAHLIDMIFGLCLALGGPLVAKFLVLLLGVLAAAGVFVIGNAAFGAEVGAWAALIFYSTPLVIWLSTTTYLDLPLALFTIASIVSLIRWRESSDRRWLALGGWITGVAIGTKIAALAILFVFPVAMIRGRWRDRTGSRLQLLATYAIPLTVVALPWYFVVYMYTGNPVFPFLNTVFRSPRWPFENTSLNALDFGIGTSPAALLRLPFRLTFNSTLFGEALPRGGIGVALLLAFPLVLILMWRAGFVQRVLLAAVALHTAIWAFTFQYGRYYIPALPFLAVLGCAVFLLESSRLIALNRLLLFCCVVAQVPIASVMFWNIAERFPIYRAFGMESEEHLLARALPAYGAARFINTVLRPGEKVLGVGVENMRLYLNGPLYTQTEVDLNRTPYEIAKFGNGMDLVDRLIDQGFVYLVVPRTELVNPAAIYPYLQSDFLERFGKRIYADGNAVVFRFDAR